MGLFPVVNGCLYVLFLKSLYPEARKTSDTSGHYLCYELRYVRRLWKHFSNNAPIPSSYFVRSRILLSLAVFLPYPSGPHFMLQHCGT